ncbi:hypothetical protein ACFX2I_032109 [Malus domestica]
MFKTASEQNSGNRSLEPQHVQKVKDASPHARKFVRSAKEAHERKTKHIDHVQSKKRLGVSEPDVSATKDDTRIKIVHARDEYDLPLKDSFSTVAPDAHGKNSKDVKSTESEERVTDSESKDKDIKKGSFNLDNTRTGKKKDRFENSNQAKNASDGGRASNQERKYQIHNTHNIKQTEP